MNMQQDNSAHEIGNRNREHDTRQDTRHMRQETRHRNHDTFAGSSAGGEWISLTAAFSDTLTQRTDFFG
jgi:hypothetical protein